MGQWKKRFPCLWIGTRFRKLQTVQDVIIATAVLHNICKIRGDVQTPPLSAYEERIYNVAAAHERTFQQQQQQHVRRPNTISNALLKSYFENMANERQ